MNPVDRNPNGGEWGEGGGVGGGFLPGARTSRTHVPKQPPVPPGIRHQIKRRRICRQCPWCQQVLVPLVPWRLRKVGMFSLLWQLRERAALNVRLALEVPQRVLPRGYGDLFVDVHPGPYEARRSQTHVHVHARAHTRFSPMHAYARARTRTAPFAVYRARRHVPTARCRS